MTILAEGSSLKDGSNVLAKIAPANSNGSMYLEREAHMYVQWILVLFPYTHLFLLRLGRITTSTERYGTALRLIDFFKIPRESGDCVVLLLVHPGLNILGRYLPPSKVNDLLLADVARIRPSSSLGDIYMTSMEGMDLMEEMEVFDIMDLATFLE